MDAKKIKAMIKNPPPPSKFGTDPNDPWSAKAGLAEETITEDMLDDFLKSRGVDPKYVSMQTKVSHAKSGEFKKWVKDRKAFKEERKIEPSHTQKKAQSIQTSKSAHQEVKTPSGPGHIRKEEIAQSEVDKFHKKLDKLVHSTFGKSSTEKKMKEEVEQVDEATSARIRLFKALEREKEKSQRAERLGKELMQPKASQSTEMTPSKPTQKEDVGDAKAAVNADGLNTQMAIMQAEKKRKLSKSASMVKDIHKKKRMVMEDLYDHEKEDKSVATYGKKPKLDVADKDDSKGEKKPQAAAVLSGGKTMTGTERDTIELDPMMRNRPNQPDATKKDDKDKKDGKKDEKKKDK